MTVTITNKEFDAICEVLDQVETDYEAASNEEYLETMSETISLVKNVIKKYKKARQKAADFQIARAYVAEQNRNKGFTPRYIDKLTRKLLREIKKKEYDRKD